MSIRIFGRNQPLPRSTPGVKGRIWQIMGVSPDFLKLGHYPFSTRFQPHKSLKTVLTTGDIRSQNQTLREIPQSSQPTVRDSA